MSRRYSRSRSRERPAKGNKIYVGNLSSRVREGDLEDEFGRYGRITRIDLKHGFGFVEFDYYKDADDAIRSMDGVDLMGRRITVEASRGGRSGGRGGGGGGGDFGARFTGKRFPHRLRVEGLDERTSWQDLKDFARKAGDVAFADVFSERGEKYGIIEYTNKSDKKYAIKNLDDTRLDGCRVRLRPEGGGSESRSRSRSRGRRDRRRSRSKSRSRSRGRKDSRSKSKSRSRSRSRSRDRRSSKKKRSRSASRSRSKSGSRSRSRSRSKSKSPVDKDNEDRKENGDGEKEDSAAKENGGAEPTKDEEMAAKNEGEDAGETA